MATEFCSKCKQAHPGRVCDFKEGECAETLYQLSEEACGFVPENDPATIDLRFTTNSDPGDEHVEPNDSKADSD